MMQVALGLGDGDEPLEPEAGVLGAAEGDVGDVPLGVVDGVPPEVGLAEALPLARPEGLEDGFLLAVEALTGVPGAAPPELAAVGLAVRADLDVLGEAGWPRAGVPDAGEPAGPWLAAGELLNAPVASSTTRPAAARAPAPAAMIPTFSRGGAGWPACDGRVTGSDMRSGTTHSSERKTAVPPPKPPGEGMAVVSGRIAPPA